MIPGLGTIAKKIDMDNADKHFLGVTFDAFGYYLPDQVIPNSSFINGTFYDSNGTIISNNSKEQVESFESITGIVERKYSTKLNASQMAARAAQNAIEKSGTSKESIDVIICAHNFGDVENGKKNSVPPIASKVKGALGIQNPKCLVFDIIQGCTGWLQAVFQAVILMRSNCYCRALVIGTETLSKVIDPYDRDSLLFSDGAGAVIISRDKEASSGIIEFVGKSICNDELHYLREGPSYNPVQFNSKDYLKMTGRKVYEVVVNHVPELIRTCLMKSALTLNDIKYIFIHQANLKLIEAIIQKLSVLLNQQIDMLKMVPLNIAQMGNNSVATLPILIGQVMDKQIGNYCLIKGDISLMISMGAGMNISVMSIRH